MSIQIDGNLALLVLFGNLETEPHLEFQPSIIRGLGETAAARTTATAAGRLVGKSEQGRRDGPDDRSGIVMV